MADPGTTHWLSQTDTFASRHLGPSDLEVQEMLDFLGLSSLEDLIAATVPEDIRHKEPLQIPPAQSEQDALAELRNFASHNQLFQPFIGMGYYDCVTPTVIVRNMFENPAWYTQYTPYQAEIAQGRLEALLNFQTMVTDLTGLPLANASLLDEGTAAAEAMAMCRAVGGTKKSAFFVSHGCHPQTIAIVQTRAHSLGINLVIGSADDIDWKEHAYCGCLLQYPTTQGYIRDYQEVIHQAHKAGALAVVATDLLALTLLRPPGEFGADIAVGSSQTFWSPIRVWWSPCGISLYEKTSISDRCLDALSASRKM